jgi:serine protease Do
LKAGEDSGMSTLWTGRRHGPIPYVFGALLGVSLGLLIVSGVLFFNSPRGGAASTPTKPPVIDDSQESIESSRLNAIVRATRAVAPAVVNITSKRTEVYRTRSPFFPREWLELWGIPDTYKKEISSLGSGIVVDPNGYILTNEHVVRNADRIEVTFQTGETVFARLVDTSHDYDLAVIRVEMEGLPHATLGNSDDLVVGEWAIAIGQPFGQLLYDNQPTVTVGVISALHRDVRENENSDQFYKDMIQTDAAINPGNSGGPLINSKGEVIGINTFIFADRGGGSLGMGFAVPSNRGKWVLAEIREHGRIRDAWLGLRVSTITPELAAGLNLDQKQGLLVREIDDESPADNADIKPGDLIIAVDGQKVFTSRQANRIIYGSRIGETLTFQILRDGKRRDIDVVLAERLNEI